MLSLILEDLHDEMTKTKYRYYMAPINAKFISTMAWLRQYKAHKIPSSTNPSHRHINEWLRPAQKWNPMHDPHSTHTHKNKDPEMIV